MSWFSSRKQELPTKPVKSSSNKKTPGVIWLETSSEKIYQKTLSNMIKEVEEMGGFPKKSHASNAYIYADTLLSKVQKLDRSRMSSDQKRDIAMIVFDSFPRAVAAMETQLADPDEMNYASEEFGDALRSLMTKYVDAMPRKIPVPNQLAPMSEESKKKTIETVGSKESDEKLTSVKVLVAEAYNRAASVEDRFFAEQAANSYIPDSIRMLAGLTHAPEDMKMEANELFMKQLGIIEAQLQGIMRRSASSSLSMMKAHTEFLESKEERLALE